MAAGAEDAAELGQACGVVCQIAEAEGGGDQVEGSDRRRADSARRLPGIRLRRAAARRARAFSRARTSMGWAKSAPVMRAPPLLDWLRDSAASAKARSPVPQQRSSTLASGRASTIAKSARYALAPHHVEAQRKQMIQQVVARGDAAEHLADLARSGGFVAGAGGAGAGEGCAGWGARRHLSRSAVPIIQANCHRERREGSAFCRSCNGNSRFLAAALLGMTA